MTKTPVPAGYADLLKEIKAPIAHAQARAVISVNAELIRLYWDIGRMIDDRQRQKGWGAAEVARTRGILIADTKFEWGELPGGDVLLIDEVLTPDSSRFWPLDPYQAGKSPPSFDKQFVRDWLETTDWDKNSPPPELPADVVERTRAKYLEAYERLTGKKLPLMSDEELA